MTTKSDVQMRLIQDRHRAVITLLLSYFISFVTISIGIKAYLETQRLATYQFTIMQLLIATPILILVCVFVPMGRFERMQNVY